MRTPHLVCAVWLHTHALHVTTTGFTQFHTPPVPFGYWFTGLLVPTYTTLPVGLPRLRIRYGLVAVTVLLRTHTALYGSPHVHRTVLHTPHFGSAFARSTGLPRCGLVLTVTRLIWLVTVVALCVRFWMPTPFCRYRLCRITVPRSGYTHLGCVLRSRFLPRSRLRVGLIHTTVYGCAPRVLPHACGCRSWLLRSVTCHAVTHHTTGCALPRSYAPFTARYAAFTVRTVVHGSGSRCRCTFTWLYTVGLRTFTLPVTGLPFMVRGSICDIPVRTCVIPVRFAWFVAIPLRWFNTFVPRLPRILPPDCAHTARVRTQFGYADSGCSTGYLRDLLPVYTPPHYRTRDTRSRLLHTRLRHAYTTVHISRFCIPVVLAYVLWLVTRVLVLLPFVLVLVTVAGCTFGLPLRCRSGLHLRCLHVVIPGCSCLPALLPTLPHLRLRAVATLRSLPHVDCGYGYCYAFHTRFNIPHYHFHTVLLCAGSALPGDIPGYLHRPFTVTVYLRITFLVLHAF